MNNVDAIFILHTTILSIQCRINTQFPLFSIHHAIATCFLALDKMFSYCIAILWRNYVNKNIWEDLFSTQEEMVEPAVNGTKTVITAAAEAKVRRVVFTSSIGTVYMDPIRSRDVVVDESCWSDLEYCKNTKVSFYYLIIS